MKLKGKRALVTGASSGLGVDFAKELARLGADLVLVARRVDRLEAVAQEIRKEHGVAVEVIAMDLGAPGAAPALYEKAGAIDVLINNAGFGLYGDAIDLDWQRERAMLELDIVTLVELTKRFAAGMRERRWGRILQVASIGAYQPTPLYASYSAAKAFVLSYGEALNYELRGTGVTCTVVSPGVTATEFLQVAGQKKTLYQRMFMMQSPEVARMGIRAMMRGKPSVVTGWANALAAWSMRLTPRRLQAAIAHLSMKQPSSVSPPPALDRGA